MIKKNISPRKNSRVISAQAQAKKLKPAQARRTGNMPKASSPKTKTLSKISVSPKGEFHLGMHVIIAVSAVAVMMVLGIIDHVRFSTLISSAADTMPATIGIEHQFPLKLSVLVARKKSAGYAEIGNDSNDTIFVSVPSSWTRSEVSGAPLSEIRQDIPVFGFTRWTLPAHANIKMLLSDAPTSLFFDSNSTTAAAINLQAIDLVRVQTSSRVVLLQSQALVKLWEEE